MHLSEIWHSKKNYCRLSRIQVNSSIFCRLIKIFDKYDVIILVHARIHRKDKTIKDVISTFDSHIHYLKILILGINYLL